MRTVSEGARGCGYRKPGGLYLMSDGVGMSCDVLPIELHVCPTCGGGVKPARGWTWIEPNALLEGYIGPHQSERHTKLCPLGKPGRLGERCGLLWIGESHYETPEEWVAEGRKMGFSRRIHNVPRGFVPGETWVLAGHRKAIQDGFVYTGKLKHKQLLENGEQKVFKSVNDAIAYGHEHDLEINADELEPNAKPGIFHIWKPSRIEYVVKGNESEEELAALEARGIEPVKVIPVHDQETLLEEVA